MTYSRISNLSIVTFIAVLVLATLAQAQTFTTLYNFTGGSDGGGPNAGVIQDKAGNLYGTTYEGGDDMNCFGDYGCGVAFKLNTFGHETVLYRFTGKSQDGLDPGTPETRDKAGNIYGTTSAGGGSSNCIDGCGTAFKIHNRTENVLHSFTGGTSDGCGPNQGLVMDEAGNLYGTTVSCGSATQGTIFKIDSVGNFSILHNFAGGDGSGPSRGHLVMDTKGNLYGLTTFGGSFNKGALYRLSKTRTLTVLHSFAGGSSDGCYPYGSVAMDKAGHFYGTTSSCGSSSLGTVWKVSKTGAETILHNFAGGASDSCNPPGGVARDSEGNLYGVGTRTFRSCNSPGTVWKLSISGTLTLLHSFDGTDGTYPSGELWRTDKGELFGTTALGGTGGHGTVWKYVP